MNWLRKIGSSVLMVSSLSLAGVAWAGGGGASGAASCPPAGSTGVGAQTEFEVEQPAQEEQILEFTTQEEGDILDMAAQAGNYNTFLSAVRVAGLENTLRQGGPFTLFAPTDDAFAKLPPGALDSLMNNPTQLREVLLLHVVPEEITAYEAFQMPECTSLATRGAEHLTLQKQGEMLFVNGAQIVQPDILANNGVLHGVDMVLLPSN